MSDAIQVSSYINGKFLPTSNQVIVVTDPGNTDRTVGHISNASLDDVNFAIECAHAAFGSWKNSTIQQRQDCLTKATAVIMEQKDRLKELLVREHGGMLWEAETDFYLGAGVMSMYAQADDTLFKVSEIAEDNGWIKIHKTAKGVISAIVPWNMPIVLTMMKLGPILLSGNTVVLKPSPFAALALT